MLIGCDILPCVTTTFFYGETEALTTCKPFLAVVSRLILGVTSLMGDSISMVSGSLVTELMFRPCCFEPLLYLIALAGRLTLFLLAGEAERVSGTLSP